MKYILSWLLLLLITIGAYFFYDSHFDLSSFFTSKNIITAPDKTLIWSNDKNNNLENIIDKYTKSGTIFAWTGLTIDKFSSVANTNPLFLQALRLSDNRDFSGSILLLEEAKKVARWTWELAIIDFNISDNQFSIDRLSWTESFIAFIKNLDYSPRIRALAMQRIYLKYIKYNDRTILQKLADGMEIKAISRPEIRLEYMKKAYELYPLPGSSIFLMQKEISSVDNKNDALIIFDKYRENIDLGIKDMLTYTWELSEVTSAMLSQAQAFGNLYRDYAISSREEVETLYKDLIQFDQEKWLKINKQYALVYYADFLSNINDIDAAQKVLKILLEDWLEPSLNESLPKTKDLTGLRSMSPITDKSIQDFIDFLWPIIK